MSRIGDCSTFVAGRDLMLRGLIAFSDGLLGTARAFVLLLVATLVSITGQVAADDAPAPYGIEQRVPWTTSRVVGSPAPPLPYTVAPSFESIDWEAPLFAVAEPGSNRLWIIERGGEKDRPSKILVIADDPAVDTRETLLEISNRLVYSVTFSPRYDRDGHIYVFSNGPNGQPERQNRVSRFTVDHAATPTCVPATEEIIIEWASAGHDGGDLVFGHDGMLYIASGDGTSDSDTNLTGQDISNLLGGVLRIDVDHASEGAAYTIPDDNPFVDTENARGELWAYGLRNPWRMCVDRETGHIWVGNNGQDLWETAHLLGRGENYGWSVYEGIHPFYLNRQRGPTPVVPPTLEHHHIEARSLTGGVVYYGKQLPELNGAYIYGDYSTGKIWGARHDGTKLTWHRELADTSLQIAGFAVSPREELLIVDITGGLYRLVPAEVQEPKHDFPRHLSETGLFSSVEDHEIAPGVIPYSVNAPGWNDGARAVRYLAIPEDGQIDYASSRGWNFPNGTVLLQTLGFETKHGEDNSLHRIETRLLTRQEGEWAGYSYRWNDDQSDATLVSANGEDRAVLLPGEEVRSWRFPARAECLSCHSRAANFVLGLSEAQTNRDHNYGEIIDNQLRTLEHIGLFKNPLPKPPEELTKLVNPYDSSEDAETRARSYLHTNCSVCHVSAGGGNSKIELGFSTALEKMELIAARPQHATFEIDNAMLVAPGDPDASVLIERLKRRGRGQMPPLVSSVVDQQAVDLMHEWIATMQPERPFVRDWKPEDLSDHLGELTTTRSFDSGRAAFEAVGCAQCHRFAGQGSGIGPDLSGIGTRLKPVELIESLVDPSSKVAPEYATTIIQTSAGTILEGRIERETDSTITLRSGGALAEPITIEKSEIEERALSPKSMMPAGILNTLTQAEILDLLAYMIANGEADHPAFVRREE